MVALHTEQRQSYRPHATIATANWLHGMGLNVLPLPYGKKVPYANGAKMYFKQMGAYYQRLPIEALKYTFPEKSNIAVVTGRTSGNLFVIDCESQESFQFHMGEANLRGIPIFATKTDRGGHLYFRCETGEVQAIPAGNMLKLGFKDVEIKGGSEGYVVAPPSKHPDGTHYQWLDNNATEPPRIAATQIDWLPLQVKSTYHIDTNEYLESGHVYPEGFRNDALYRSAHDMAFRDENPHKIEYILTKIALESGLENKEIPRTIHNGTRNGQQKSKQTKLGIHDGLALFVADYEGWTGRKGNTDRAVFEALIERSRRDNKGTGKFRASSREVAELAKVTKKTANASLHRLEDAGMINRINDVSRGQVAIWSFSSGVVKSAKEKLSNSRNDYTNAVGYKRHSSVVITQNPISERKSLGKTATRVYDYLQQTGKSTAKEIAEVLNLSIHQVYRALSKAKLRAHSLVKTVKRGIWDVCKNVKRAIASLSDIGRGASIKRKDLHRRERQARIVVHILNALAKMGISPPGIRNLRI